MSGERDLIAAFVHDDIHEDGTGVEGGNRGSRPGNEGRLRRLLSDPARDQPSPTSPWAQPSAEPLALVWRMRLAVARQRQTEEQAKMAAARSAERAEERYQQNLALHLERDRRARVHEQQKQLRSAAWDLLTERQAEEPDWHKHDDEAEFG